MLDQIMTLAVEYRLAIMIAVLVLLVLLLSKKRWSSKVLLILTSALALSIIYEIVTDEPASRIPGRINRALNQSNDSTKSSNPHYYVPPEERYNLPEGQ